MHRPGQSVLEDIRKCHCLEQISEAFLPPRERRFAGGDPAKLAFVRAQYRLREQMDRVYAAHKGIPLGALKLLPTCSPYGMFVAKRKFTCKISSVCPGCHARHMDEMFSRLAVHADPDAGMNFMSFSKRPSWGIVSRSALDDAALKIKYLLRRLSGVTLVYRAPAVFNRGVGLTVAMLNISGDGRPLPSPGDYGIPAHWKTEPAATKEVISFYVERHLHYDLECLNPNTPAAWIAGMIRLNAVTRFRIAGEDEEKICSRGGQPPLRADVDEEA